MLPLELVAVIEIAGSSPTVPFRTSSLLPVSVSENSLDTLPLMITPAPMQYHGPVAVLVDGYTHSAAENIAWVLQDLPNPDQRL